MTKIVNLIFSEKNYVIVIDANNAVAKEILKCLPIVSEANNIGGEIYFRVPSADIEYDGTERENFEKGDVVYWRSPAGEKKFSIALMYGNTIYGKWESVRTSDPCVKIGRIIDGIENLAEVKTGEKLSVIQKPY